MRHFQQTDDNAGDFSVSFGDMVFGLLFFFFILSLAMIFNRPDVKSFIKQDEKLRRELVRKEKIIKKLERQRTEAEIEARRIENELKAARAASAELEKQMERLKRETESLAGANERVIDRLRRMEAREREIEAKERSAQSDLRSTRDRLKRTDDRLRRRNVQVSRYQDVFSKIEETLEQNGMLDVLAEVKAIREGREPGDGGTVEGMDGEDDAPPLETTTIHARLFDGNNFSVSVRRGDSVIVDRRPATFEELIAIVERYKKDYDAQAANYPDSERTKYQPRVFLMNNPAAAYGTVEDFLRKLRKVIPVSIVPWTEE